MAGDKERMKSCYWLERTSLICLLYCAVNGDKQYFISLLICLLFHDFIIFMVNEFYSSIKIKTAQFNKSTSNSNQTGTNLIKGFDNLKERGGDDDRHQVSSDNLEVLLELEVAKVKENYKQKLQEKEKKFKREKSLLKDKYNEDREKWEEEKILLKKKYEEMRWT